MVTGEEVGLVLMICANDCRACQVLGAAFPIHDLRNVVILLFDDLA
jgi:hypothetical protein